MDSLSTLLPLLTNPDEDELLSKEFMVNLLAKRQQLTGHPEYMDAVFIALGLDLEVMKRFMDTGNPSARMPYHCTDHEASVVVGVYEGAYYHNLSQRQTLNLVVAAAMHDYNHWGDLARSERISDAVNINAAIIGLQQLKDAGIDFDLIEVERLIKATEFPYNADVIQVDEAIIRDADLSMPLLNDEQALKLFQGLWREIHANKVELTYEQYADSMIGFYETYKPCSSWGASLRNDGRFEGRVNRLTNLLKENPLEAS